MGWSTAREAEVRTCMPSHTGSCIQFGRFPPVHTRMPLHTGNCIQFSKFIEAMATRNVHSQLLNYAYKGPLVSFLITNAV